MELFERRIVLQESACWLEKKICIAMGRNCIAIGKLYCRNCSARGRLAAGERVTIQNKIVL